MCCTDEERVFFSCARWRRTRKMRENVELSSGYAYRRVLYWRISETIGTRVRADDLAFEHNLANTYKFPNNC